MFEQRSSPASSEKRWLPPLLIALATLAAIAPSFFRGSSCGHDFDFHLVSWMEVARDWHAGLAYPHWISSANYGAGEPRLVFYPPASWLLGALLGSLFGWTAAPVLFVVASLFAAGLSMHRLAREWLPDPSATIAACLYVANPYTLFVVYERAAYGELLAAAFIPLVLLFALRQKPPVAALAFAVAATWLSNAPAGVIACYTLLWFALLQLLCERSLWPALRIGSATLLGLGLDSFYLVPAAYEQRWVQISRAILPGMRVQDSFLFAHTGEPLHDGVLRTASWIAVLLIAIAVVGALVWWRLEITSPLQPDDDPVGTAGGRTAMQARFAFASLPVLVLFLLLPVSAPLWRVAPHLRFLQFPWRWLIVVSPVAALSLSGALVCIRRKEWQYTVACTLAVLSIVLCSTLYFQHCDDEDAIPAQVALLASEEGQEGTDEYTALGVDNSAIQQNLPPVRVLRSPDAGIASSTATENPPWQPDSSGELPAQIHLEHWQGEDRRLTIKNSIPGYAVLRLEDYPRWQILRNGVVMHLQTHREDGLIAVPLSAGAAELEVKWVATPDVFAGEDLSLAFLATVVSIVILKRRRLLPE